MNVFRIVFGRARERSLRCGDGRNGRVAPLRVVVAAAALIAGAAPAGAAAAEISSVAPDTAVRSGRVVVTGSGFGTTRPTVRIAGLPAFTTRWSDSRVVAYVPEAAPVGTATVEVIGADGSTAAASLEVTARPPAGERVLWRFEMDGISPYHRAAVGPDGTVYAHDGSFLFALTPDGALKWVYPGAGAEGQVDVGPDGTVYVGRGWRVTALNPDGTRKWVFEDPCSQGLIAGPNVGPDGNVYLVMDWAGICPGLGAISLTPDGTVRWRQPGDPVFYQYGQLGEEIAFGSGRMYVAFENRYVPSLYGLRLDSGGQDFATPIGAGNGAPSPTVGPNGDLYMSYGIVPALHAFSPAGDVRWSRYRDGSNDLTQPDVGIDGNLHLVRNQHYVESVTTAGSDRFSVWDPHILRQPVASPTESLMLIGAHLAYGQNGAVKAYDLRGRLQWQFDLPWRGDACLVPSSDARFRPDGAAAYVSAQWLCSYNPPHSAYLYAFRTGSGTTPPPPPPPPPPADATDTVTVSSAEYATSKRVLRVEARSSDATATLRAHVTATGQLIGTLSNKGNGSYSGRFSWPSSPQQITVRSSAGGSATATVTVKR